ncbi:pickpocket protein 28-like [Chironomus tepperi]|uniref:pickpocket protein 28-like n=1 Tax=Chironomus tepperi TaxID=113505 RepID=UPI00391F6102
MSFAAAFNRKKLAKIFKFFGYFLLLIGLGYQTQRLYKKLKIEPEIFTKESSIQSSQIPFPAVTICPPYTVKPEAWTPEYLKLNNLTENDLRAAHILTCKGDHEISIKYISSDSNLVNIMLKASPDFRDFFQRCGINKYYADVQGCDKLFIKSMTDKGICYTLNMIGHQSIFNDDISSDFDIYKRTKVTKSWTFDDTMNEAHHDDKNDPQPSTWSPETGYISNQENIQPIRALKMQKLVVDTNHFQNKTLCEGREKSFKIILHLPNEIPQISYDAIDYPIGKEKVILISAEVSHNEDSLKEFPPETRGCYFDGEKHLMFFKAYTKGNCEYECMSNLTYKKCGCAMFSMVRTDEMKVCDAHCGCDMNIIFSFPRNYYEDPENKKKYPHYPCGCLPSCTEIKYKVIKHIEKDNDHSEKHFYSIIHIVFGDSQIKKTSIYVTYEIENFIFDIGGLIGLFLGSSIISVLALFVCKSLQNHAVKVFKWFQLDVEMGNRYSTNVQGLQSANQLETMTEISANGNHDAGLFVITGMCDSPFLIRTVQADDLKIDDVEN